MRRVARAASDEADARAEREFRRTQVAAGACVRAADVEGLRAALGANPAAARDVAQSWLQSAIERHDRAIAAALVAVGARPRVAWLQDWLGKRRDPQAIAMAIDSGLDLDAAKPCRDGLRTPLMLALEAGDVALSKRWIELGARLADAPGLATTYLNAAAASGVPGVVGLVLDCGVDPRATDAFGDSALHAVAYGPVVTGAAGGDVVDRASVVRLLLARGVDPRARERLPRTAGFDTALLIAANRWHDDVIGALVAAGACEDGAEATRLFDMVLETCNGATAAALVRAGARPPPADDKRPDALRRAVDGRCDAGVVRVLLDAGCPVDAPGAAGRTPLHEAIARGNSATVRLLLDRGASLAARDARGRDARMLALSRIASGREVEGSERPVEEFDADGFVSADVAEIGRLLGVPTAERPATRAAMPAGRAAPATGP